MAASSLALELTWKDADVYAAGKDYVLVRWPLHRGISARYGERTRRPKNVAFVIDRSGSMDRELYLLGQNLKKEVRQLQMGDSASMAWFSSGFKWFLTGFRLTSEADFNRLDRVIDQNLTSLDTTCFSGVLKSLPETLDTVEAATGTKQNSLVFLTDGEPVVPNLRAELKDIFDAIRAVRSRFQAVKLIGFRDWWNRILMAQMAIELGGVLVHSRTALDVHQEIDTFISNQEQTFGKLAAKLPMAPNPGDITFTLASGEPVPVTGTADGLYEVPDADNDYLFILTPRTQFQGPLHMPLHAETDKSLPGSVLEAMYGGAYLAGQQLDMDAMLGALAATGDKAVIDRAQAAFTVAEYGEAGAKMLQAIKDPAARYENGVEADYVPAKDGPSILWLLHLLAEDEDAAFYPCDPRFDYQTIHTRQANLSQAGEKFIRDPLTTVKFSALVMHQTEMNVSVRAYLPGTLIYPDPHGAQALGLPPVFPTFVWRSYAFIGNGHCNVKTVPVTLSEKSYGLCREWDILGDQDMAVGYLPGRVYLLHLDRLPVMTRAMADDHDSATELCRKVMARIEAAAILKVLNYYLELNDPKAAKASLGLTEQYGKVAADYLASLHVTDSGYRPPMEDTEDQDPQPVRQFTVKAGGFSNLPSVDSVRTKCLAAQKKGEDAKLTPVQDKVWKGLFALQMEGVLDSKLEQVGSPLIRITAIKGLIEKWQKTLRDLDAEIQSAKFAVVMANRWFREFKSRDESEIVVDGVKFTLELAVK